MLILHPLPLYTTYRRRGLTAWIACGNLLECKFPDVKELKGVRIVGKQMEFGQMSL